MRTHQPTGVTTILAAVALAKHLFVDAAGGICGANKKAVGVTELDAASGEQASVIFSGIALVTAGGNITVTDEPVAVVSDAAGEAVAATALSATVPAGATPVTSTSDTPAMTMAGSVTPQAINGYALHSALDGELVAVLLA